MTSPAKEAEFKSALLALTGRLLADEIDEELLEVLRSPGIAEMFEDIDPGCLEIDLEEAATEYHRLFVPPEGSEPAASSWLPDSGSVNTETIEDLVDEIAMTLCLSLPDDLPLDHASVLLPMLGWMVENQPDSVPEFFESTLMPWLSPFAKALEDGARLPIYQATGEILMKLTEKDGM
jgi:TorA maturation chaperone TorD